MGLLADSKPFCFSENNEIKGIETNLVYQFAKSKNYNVKIVEFMNTEDRLKIGEKDRDFNMKGGSLPLQKKERNKNITFSNLFKIGTSLIIRKD